jgi:acyl-CoA hydrolase
MKNQQSLQSTVDQVIQKIGKKIVLGIPLGAGKPNHLVNSIYNKAKSDPSIHLTICTALTLQRPKGKSDLEQRFIDLFEDRIFGNYPDLDYELDRMSGQTPENIEIIEFYFAPGKYLKNIDAQRNYVSSNYTHIVRDIIDRGINVLAQAVSKKEIEGETHYSLSCNPDITLDIAKIMKGQEKDFMMVAQVNQNLPFMFGDAMVEENFFDLVVDKPEQYFQVFGTPKMSVSDADFMIGLYCSALVHDDGEIQIGIGSLGDATIYNLIQRQKNNEIYHELLDELKVDQKFGDVIQKYGDTGIFKEGLFGASEMIVDGFMHLFTNGIIKKKVYDHFGLQRLLNNKELKEHFDENILKLLWKNKLIHERISEEDFNFLQKWGIFKEDLKFQKEEILTKDNIFIVPNIGDNANHEFIKEHCLGSELKNGQVMHGGFFLGPQNFYKWLNDLPENERKLINMKSVQKINQLYGHEDLDRLHRKNARFINTCMLYTLSGAAVSDGLEDGRVVSGVGGQYNFVAMAQELPDGHSILNLRSTRTKNGKLSSNIVPKYGHITIPRHLRDIVVTEYGIALIRGRTDQEIIIELLKITDSRFQHELMKWAKEKGKLDESYVIPDMYRHNYPESYLEIIKKYKVKGLYPTFPFGTELTKEELKLGKALKSLKASMEASPLKAIISGLGAKSSKEDEYLLAMMKLDEPKTLKERLYKKLITSKLHEN